MPTHRSHRNRKAPSTLCLLHATHKPFPTMALYVKPNVLIGQIPKMVARSTKRASPRLGPNPYLQEAKRVVPAVAIWGSLMFGFLAWPSVVVEANKAGYWYV
ncbi:unnamed protein product [Kuraishia capsulata CBS 1993]|uniref:Uncharacterized protein n=1 Tax=Kuraishia capsulata CBS 1993 TaxID=1382522 RepID=W6MG17_9ASCO|nr:uncharacterized protein KUCA_T00000891001 [Kuraishia capsulata CBS 1993]CDK24924.1 unnamed protein product [Kuraishia capsulata CBS 1993]